MNIVLENFTSLAKA